MGGSAGEVGNACEGTARDRPPEAVKDYHQITLAFLKVIDDIANEQGRNDEVNPYMLFDLRLLALAASLTAVEEEMSDDVRRTMIQHGCIEEDDDERGLTEQASIPTATSSSTVPASAMIFTPRIVPTSTPAPPPTQTPVPTPTNTPSPTPTNTPVPPPTSTPVPVPTQTPLPTPTSAPPLDQVNLAALWVYLSQDELGYLAVDVRTAFDIDSFDLSLFVDGSRYCNASRIYGDEDPAEMGCVYEEKTHSSIRSVSAQTSLGDLRCARHVDSDSQRSIFACTWR